MEKLHEVSIQQLKEAYSEINYDTVQEIYRVENIKNNQKSFVTFSDVDNKSNFTSGYNKNGEYISFNSPMKKLSVDINLYGTIDSRTLIQDKINNTYDGSIFQSVRDRGLTQRNTISLYINGLKIPDIDIYLSIFDGLIDVYLPISYFKEKSSIVNIIKNNYSEGNEYYNEYYSKAKLIILNDIYDANSFAVYSNGLLVTSEDYKIQSNSDTVSILLNKELPNVEVRSTGNCYKIPHTIKMVSNLLFIDYEDTELPLNPDILEVYVNGIREMPNNIKPIMSKYFLLEKIDADVNINNVDVYIHYDIPNLMTELRYSDQFTEITDILSQQTVDSVLLYNKKFDIPKCFNLNYIKENFVPEYMKPINPVDMKYVYKTELENRLKFFTALNPFYFRVFLEHFLVPEEVSRTKIDNKKSYTRMDTSKELGTADINYFKLPRVVVSTIEKDDWNQILVYKNGKLLEKSQWIFYNQEEDYQILDTIYKANKLYVYIDASIITDNDIIEIKTQLSNSIKESLSISREFNNTFNAISNNDFIVQVKLKDGRVTTLNSEKYNSTITTSTITIDIPNSYYNNLIEDITLMNTYYNTWVTTYVPDFIPDTVANGCVINSGKIIGIPDIEYQGNFEVFWNGQPLVETQDYKVLVPEINNDISSTQIILLFIPNINDRIDIVVRSFRKQLINTFTSIQSEYALVYVNANYPASPKYMEFILNGEVLLEDQIKIISDNLVLIKGINERKNLVILSKVYLDFDFTQELLKIYNQNESTNVNGLEHLISNKTNKGLLDTWITTGNDEGVFKDGLFKKIFNNEVYPPNPDIPGSIIKPPYVGDGFDIGLDSLAKAFIAGKITRRIDSNKPDKTLTEFSFYPYFSSNDAIPLNANLETILVEAYFNANTLYLSIPQVSGMFAKEIVDDTAAIKEGVFNYPEDPISHYIYPENEIILDANMTLDDNYVINSNIPYNETNK